MQDTEILKRFNSLSNPKAVAGMAKYGINPENAYGISIPDLRRIARDVGRNHELAERLWSSGIHEARILACMIDDPKDVSEQQLERWVGDFDSWDVCDQCCNKLFIKTAFAYQKAVEWTTRDEEYVKRAGFVLMAQLAVHDKEAHDNQFERFFPTIKREAADNRNFVKKAVNWALRQIGKRNVVLNKKAVKVAEEIHSIDSRSATWIATDALRELTSHSVRKRLNKKS
jgi:3-methyladenine DNA glycosylase AlkD